MILLTTDSVLEQFQAQLDEAPDTPAKRWVLENMPGHDDAAQAIVKLGTAA